MKIGFAGTPVFAQAALEALIAHGHDVRVVLTQPDRPGGRGLKLTASPVKQSAHRHGIKVLQPHSLKLDGRYADQAQAAQVELASLDLDVLVVAAYGLILPPWLLALPRHGCLNIHASLLPRWRGAAPIQRAIEAGDDTTGITIMQMDQGLDTGDMLLTQTIQIEPHDDAQTLHDKLAEIGSTLIVRALDDLAQGRLVAVAQPNQGVTYAEKIQKAESALDLRLPAAQLVRQIRAFNPFPGASLKLPNLVEPVKVWRACETGEPTNEAPGTLLAANQTGIDLATGQGVLRLLTLQKPGGKRQAVEQFVLGYSGIK
jgi:methionyl-tRNA formyltransferase